MPSRLADLLGKRSTKCYRSILSIAAEKIKKNFRRIFVIGERSFLQVASSSATGPLFQVCISYTCFVCKRFFGRKAHSDSWFSCWVPYRYLHNNAKIYCVFWKNMIQEHYYIFNQAKRRSKWTTEQPQQFGEREVSTISERSPRCSKWIGKHWGGWSTPRSYQFFQSIALARANGSILQKKTSKNCAD